MIRFMAISSDKKVNIKIDVEKSVNIHLLLILVTMCTSHTLPTKYKH